MSEYSSYFLYQKYEKRGDQDWLPCYPNVYSVDGDGTMPLVMKKEYDQQCGYTGGCDPQYDWVEIPIDEDYECDECDLSIQTRWVDYTDAFTYFGDYKYGIQILETKVEDGEWTRTNQTKYTTNPIGKADRKIIVETENGVEWSARCGTSDGRYYNYPCTADEWFHHETTDNSGLFESLNFCETVPCYVTSVTFGDCVTQLAQDCHGEECKPASGTPSSEPALIYFGQHLKSVTFNENIEGIIPGGYFMGNTGLTSISIPTGITSLGPCEPSYRFCDVNGSGNNDEGAFQGCGLISVHTKNTQIIGRNCFADNSDLRKVTIGSACTRIDMCAFDNCINLQQIVFEGSTVPGCHRSGAGYMNEDTPWYLTDYQNSYGPPHYLPPTCKIYVPCDALDSFKNSSATTAYTDIIYGYGGSCGDIPFIPTDYKVKSLTYLVNGEPVTVRDLILDDAGTGNFTSVDRNTIYQMGISNIIEIEFGDCVRTISDEVFQNVELTKVVLNNGLVSIGSNAFHGFMGRELVIPDSVTTIGSWAFSRPSGVPQGELRHLTIGSGITSISEGCFYRTVESMTSLSIPDNITSIGEDAFYGCNNLSQLHIGSGITSIASDAFYHAYNTGFTDITIEALTPPTIVFQVNSCFGSRSRINVHCSVVEDYIDEYKTHGSYSGTIDSIESECSGRTQTRWVESGTTCVGYDKYNQVAQEVSNDFGQTWSGNGVTSATTLIETDSTDCGYIPENYSFKVTYADSTVRASEYTGSTLTSGQTITLLSGHENTQAEIGTGITSLDTNCLYGMGGMTSLTIPNGVVSLGYNALRNCNGLTSLTIPDSVTTIGQYAIDGCSGLTALTVGSGVTSIPTGTSSSFSSLSSLVHLTWNAPASIPYGFNNLPHLETVVIGNTTQGISGYGFNNCSALTSVTIGSSVRTIVRNAFYGCCMNISNFVNNSSLDEVANEYWGCTIYDTDADGVLMRNGKVVKYVGSDGNVIIPNSATSIGDYVFSYNYTITSCTIGSGITSIGSGAFNECSGLTNVEILDSPATIAGYAFEHCTSLTSITLGNSVTSIGDETFRYCDSLSSITIPNSVTSIGSYAFGSCTSLTSVTIGSGVMSIGTYAFYDCNGLESITINRTTPPSLGNYALNSTNNCPIYVPATSVETYKAANGWKNYKSRIQAIPS